MNRTSLCATLLCAPALAFWLVPPTAHAAAAPSPDATVAAAHKSPLYRRTLVRSGLNKAGLAKIDAGGGVTIDFARYVTKSALDQRPELRGLAAKKLRGTFITAKPSYSETIVELQDRMIVDRKLEVTLTPGACSKPQRPKAIAELCVRTRAAKKAPKALATELAGLRAKLAKQPGSRIVSGSVTVAEARKLDDAGLVDLLLNGGTRTIRHLSVIPRRTSSTTVVSATRNFAKPHKIAKTDLVAAPVGGSAGGPVQAWSGPPKTFDTDYFLTGFTLGQQIDDTWEYTLADASWWHGRYYVRLDYHLSYGVGLRAPFSVDVRSGGSTTKQTVEMKVAPVDVDDNGDPAYAAVGLPKNKRFGGKEMVLELEANCHLKVSIPGPDVDKDCPKLDKDFSRDIDPVIGTERSKIGAWWLDGDKIGLGVSVSVASASLDLGLGADVTNGKIGVRVAPKSGAKLSTATQHLWFTDRQAKSLTVTRSTQAQGAGITLDRPKYGFDVQLRPLVRANVGVDVGVWDKEWTLGPYPIDFLSVSPSFVLDHHDGTVTSHSYEVFGGGLKAQLPKATLPPAKPSPKPAKPFGGPTGKLPGGPLK